MSSWASRVIGGVLLLLTVGALALWRLHDGSPDHALAAPASVDEVVSAISGMVPGAQRDTHVPGVGVAVTAGGELVWSQTFGVSADTVFEAGSISKTVAAAAILTLAGRGVVDLDAPVSVSYTHLTLPTIYSV